jgi:hypothetical protein
MCYLIKLYEIIVDRETTVQQRFRGEGVCGNKMYEEHKYMLYM